jgi:curved DNA-binding protein CbpA
MRFGMVDPYITLGVSHYASDEEIKDKYRELAKKYHPDNYQDSPLADLASDKMKEINEAYDMIMEERKKSKPGENYVENSNADYTGSYSANTYTESSNFANVRTLLINGKILEAEEILNSVESSKRNAEWFFLKGSVQYKNGFLEDAYTNFSAACTMDPQNSEYRAAFNQVQNQRSGAYGGYNPNQNIGGGGCSVCDICAGLACADCCCESMGHSCIPCC